MSRGGIRTSVNGVLRQDAGLTDLIWSVPEVIAYLTHSIALSSGDLIYTGTPAGVGALSPGDRCVVSGEGLGSVTTAISE